MADNEENKIIIKRGHLPGVDLSLFDTTLLSSVKPRVNKVTLPIYKRQGIAYIGFRQQLDQGDVVQMKGSSVLYRVIKLKKVSDRDWFIYRIKRVDGSNITQFDIDSTPKGEKALVVNRRTFQQITDQEQKLYGSPGCEPCPPSKDPADYPSICENKNYRPLSQEELNPNPQPTCSQYRVSVDASFTSKPLISLDCDGTERESALTTGKFPIEFVICAQDRSLTIDGNSACISGEDCASPEGLLIERIGDCA